MLAAATVAAALAYTPLPPASLPRSEVTAARVGRSIYVAGGFGRGGHTTRTVERYDFARRRWSSGPDFPGPARNHTGGVVPGLSPSPTIEFFDVPARQP